MGLSNNGVNVTPPSVNMTPPSVIMHLVLYVYSITYSWHGACFIRLQETIGSYQGESTLGTFFEGRLSLKGEGDFYPLLKRD